LALPEGTNVDADSSSIENDKNSPSDQEPKATEMPLTDDKPDIALEKEDDPSEDDELDELDLKYSEKDFEVLPLVTQEEPATQEQVYEKPKPPKLKNYNRKKKKNTVILGGANPTVTTTEEEEE